MNVRLEAWELKEIIKSYNECFEENDQLWLFGSRANLNKRGGDIDLYNQVQDYDIHKVLKANTCFWNLLQERFGEQKIDIVVHDPNQDLLIYKVAQQEGIKIV